MNIYESLKENKEEVLFVDRTGTIVAVYCKDDVKVLFNFPTINMANRKFREYRRELEGVKI